MIIFSYVNFILKTNIEEICQIESIEIFSLLEFDMICFKTGLDSALQWRLTLRINHVTF